ncbi:MAG: 5'/3'-nucleotidase SurE [Clostridiales Family XIII bacterium]|jgi:5'-nucleotidase|nr:5'/3'-nucleotidase SurE [Clostridiales Family XIII bacterium]
MNILLTNDDGIDAAGLRQLADALGRAASIYVCAPKEQKSASGHGITVIKRLNFREVKYPGAARAIEIDGTPADCVKVGLYRLKQDGILIDKVFSGINHGSNLGTDTLYSGTVGAAMEGALNMKPSVAVSVDARNPIFFEAASRLALSAAALPIEAHGHRTVLNINVPDAPPNEIKGVKITRLGVMEYTEEFNEEYSSEEDRGYWYAARQVFTRNGAPDVDVTEHRRGYATITPLQSDLTDEGLIKEMLQDNRWDNIDLNLSGF